MNYKVRWLKIQEVYEKGKRRDYAISIILVEEFTWSILGRACNVIKVNCLARIEKIKAKADIVIFGNGYPES